MILQGWNVLMTCGQSRHVALHGPRLLAKVAAKRSYATIANTVNLANWCQWRLPVDCSIVSSGCLYFSGLCNSQKADVDNATSQRTGAPVACRQP